MATPIRLIGVYRADGGLMGELRYLAGHYLRGEHCSLCDITHSPFRRKREWDEHAVALGIPFELLHLNEMDAGLAGFVADRAACVVGEYPDGYRLLLGDGELAACKGDVRTFFELVSSRLSQPD